MNTQVGSTGGPKVKDGILVVELIKLKFKIHAISIDKFVWS